MQARAFALSAHGDQTYGDLPYLAHLAAVAALLETRQLPEVYRTAGWLHDVLEDTSVSRAELVARFGEQVAELVDAVTGEGQNRKARCSSTVQKLTRFPKAVILKLADRLANVRQSVKDNKLSLLRMYAKELPAYRVMFEVADAQWAEELSELLAPYR